MYGLIQFVISDVKMILRGTQRSVKMSMLETRLDVVNIVNKVWQTYPSLFCFVLYALLLGAPHTVHSIIMCLIIWCAL